MMSRDNYVMLLVLVIIENMTLVTIIEMPSVVLFMATWTFIMRVTTMILMTVILMTWMSIM